MTDPACLVCEVEEVTNQRLQELHQALQVLNPLSEPNYDEMFRRLTYEINTLRMIRGQFRATNRKKLGR